MTTVADVEPNAAGERSALETDENLRFEVLADELETQGFTLAEAYALLTGADENTRGVPRITVAAAEVHTGAMIALVPRASEARRLALDGFEEPEQLHVTLVYLGEAADFDADARRAVTDVVRRYAGHELEARAFNASVFNPDGDEPALVLGVGNDGGRELGELRSNVYSGVRGLANVEVPENHTPWIPHITLAYGDPVTLLALLPQALERIGPVTLNRVRVAFGGEIIDIPLVANAEFIELEDDNDDEYDGEYGGEYEDVLAAASDHWKKQPRDPGGEDGGQWTKAPSAGGVVADFDKLKRAIPAVIYKKHADGAVVARSRDGREISYDAKTNSFRLGGKKLTKKAAYDELKNVGKWAEPSGQAAKAKVGKPQGTPKKASTAVPTPVGTDISSSVDYEALPDAYNHKTHENEALKDIIRQQGFDGKPRVVSASDFDASVKRGEVREMWRGLSKTLRSADEKTLAEQYRTGDFYVGLGINGDGTYMAPNKADAEIYGSHLLRIGLRSDAKVISADDLDAEMDAYFAANVKEKSAKLDALDKKLLRDLANAKTARARALVRKKYRIDVYGLDVDRSHELQRDPGIFAALRGYDAVEIPKDRSPDKHHELILLNRSATIVQEA